MEMKMNHEKIKQLRLNNAWSQSELADLANLSLRTIQRIEKNGKASLESAKALASVFETNIQQLDATHKKANFWAIPVVSLAMAGLLFFMPATAEDIMLNVLLKNNNQVLADVQLLNKANQESELRLGNDLKLVFNASLINDKKVRVGVKIFQRNEQHMQLISQPEIITKHQHTAIIQTDDFYLELKPNL